LITSIPTIWAVSFLVLFVIFIWGLMTSSLVLKIVRAPLDVNPRTLGLDFEIFKTHTSDKVEIDGWFVPSKNHSKSTIFVLHGWGANRSDVIPSSIFLANEYNLVYFDFRNHGRSGGKYTSLTCAEIKDLKAVVQYIETEKKDLSERLAIYGFSMGAAVALSATPDLPQIRAVIAESPFSSYNKVVTRFAKHFYGIPGFIVPLTYIFVRFRLGYDPEKCSPLYHVGRISPRPVFIIQGGSDSRMPPSEGKSLYEKAGEPKEIWIVPDADHGEAQEIASEEYQRKILAFYKKWMET